MAALCALALSMAGCAHRSGTGDACVAQAKSDVQWPPRDVDRGHLELEASSPRVSYDRVGRSDRGLLWEVDVPPNEPIKLTYRVQEQSVDSWMLLADPIAGRRERMLVYSSADAMKVRPVEGGLDEEFLRTIVSAIMVTGRMRFMTVLEPSNGNVTGTCIILPGMLGPSPVEEHLKSLVARGWRVVHFDTADLHRAFRVYSRGSFSPPTPRHVARMLNGELADSAYAVELAVKALHVDRERVEGKPLVLVGASLGAIELPACAARLVDVGLPRPDAFVFFGGGVGIDQILLDGAAGVNWLQCARAKVPKTESEQLEWRRTLREEVALAPERCLWSVDGARTLVVSAEFDAVVPAATGERLWRELGWPERWLYPLGHIGLFLLLGSSDWESLADWIAATTTIHDDANAREKNDDRLIST